MKGPLTPKERFLVAQRAASEAYREENEATLAIFDAGGVLEATPEQAERWIASIEQYARCLRHLVAARDAVEAAPATPEQIAARERAWAEVQ